ncbi:hypothetical protein COOONC_22091 [Cooperia oncophora]
MALTRTFGTNGKRWIYKQQTWPNPSTSEYLSPSSCCKLYNTFFSSRLNVTFGRDHPDLKTLIEKLKYIDSEVKCSLRFFRENSEEHKHLRKRDRERIEIIEKSMSRFDELYRLRGVTRSDIKNYCRYMSRYVSGKKNLILIYLTNKLLIEGIHKSVVKQKHPICHNLPDPDNHNKMIQCSKCRSDKVIKMSVINGVTINIHLSFDEQNRWRTYHFGSIHDLLHATVKQKISQLRDDCDITHFPIA